MWTRPAGRTCEGEALDILLSSEDTHTFLACYICKPLRFVGRLGCLEQLYAAQGS